MQSLISHHRVPSNHLAAPCSRFSGSRGIHQSPRNRKLSRRCPGIVDFKDGKHRFVSFIRPQQCAFSRAGIPAFGLLEAPRHPGTHIRSCVLPNTQGCALLGLCLTSRLAQQVWLRLSTQGSLIQFTERRIPQSLEEVDNGQILGFGADLAEDHPGYRDQAYKDRRRDIGNLARAHRCANEVL